MNLIIRVSISTCTPRACAPEIIQNLVLCGKLIIKNTFIWRAAHTSVSYIKNHWKFHPGIHAAKV